MKSSSGNLNNNIENILTNRFSSGNVLPKTKNTQLKSIEEKIHSSTPSNTQEVKKQNLKILKNNKAIQQIARTQSIEDKKGILRNDGYSPQVNDSYLKRINAIQQGNHSAAYTKEEIQHYNASIPIRGSYRESNGSSLPMLPPKNLTLLQDKQKKSQKKVTISVDHIAVSHNSKQNELNNTTRVPQQKLTDKKSNQELDGVLGSKNFSENIETNTEKQYRIDGQIKRYMEKIGLKKRDKFPVFYTLDENGNEVKTSLSNPQMYAKMTNQQQPYLVQQKANTMNIKQGNYMNENKKLNRAGISEDKLSSQNDNLEDIMKICSEFQKTIVTFDKKNKQSAKRNNNDFRKLSNQMKQLDLQNLIIQEADDPALQPYFQHLKQSGRVKEPRIKDLLES